MPEVALAQELANHPKGARSRLITERGQAMELAAPEIVRILIARTQCGDSPLEVSKYQAVVAASLKLKDSRKVRTPADVPAVFASLAIAVGNGTNTIDEATASGNLLQRFLDIYETAHRLEKAFPAG